jgi:hypothetical protein
LAGFFIRSSISGFTIILSAQDCKTYLFLQKNKVVEMTIYNKKGEANGRKVYQVSDVVTTGGVTSGNLATEMFDKNGKSMAKAASTVRCDGGVMMIDMKMMMPQEQQEKYNNMEAKADNVYLEYPSGMHVGDALKDGTMSMEMNNNGMQQTVNMTIRERKILNQESVTTSAGTWDCYKIGFKCKMGVKMGPINIPFNFDGTEWYSPGFGVVKSESKYGGTAITSIK